MTMDIPGTCAFTRAFSASASILARIARSSGSFLSSVATTCCAIAAEPGQRQMIAINPANRTDRTGSGTVRFIFFSPFGILRECGVASYRRTTQLPAGWTNRLEVPAWEKGSAFQHGPCAQRGRGGEARALLVSHLADVCRPPLKPLRYLLHPQRRPFTLDNIQVRHLAVGVFPERHPDVPDLGEELALRLREQLRDVAGGEAHEQPVAVAGGGEGPLRG